VDTDPQRSAGAWAEARERLHPEAEEPPVIAQPVEQLAAVLEAARTDGYDLVLVDTPPHSSAATAAVARRSDLAVIATRPSPFDLAAIGETLALVRATTTPALVVLNACPARTREAEEAREYLATALEPLRAGGEAVWDGQVGDRTVFRRSVAAGLTVLEMEPGGRGAEEVSALWDTLAARLAELEAREATRGRR
jgi:chromosome partitioning protein